MELSILIVLLGAVFLVLVLALILKTPISAVWKNEKGEISLNIGKKND